MTCVVTEYTKAAFAHAGEPKKLLTYEGLHYDVHDKPAILQMASEAARDWFVQHLRA